MCAIFTAVVVVVPFHRAMNVVRTLPNRIYLAHMLL